MSSSVLLRNGLLVTMNKEREVIQGDLLIEGEKISQIAPRITPPPGAIIIDVTDHFVIPGLIQAHTHLVQTLFRGDADDLSLLDWLQKKIWPMEHAHNPSSITSSARLGLLEMNLSGTTSIVDMATVKHTHHVLAAAEESGMRYWGGKCLMDLEGSSGPLYEDIKSSQAETEELFKGWHQKTPRLSYALCPRFVISCSDEMLEYTKDFQAQHEVYVHTHASENVDEVALVRERTGRGNIEFLKEIELLNPRTVVAHGIHLSEDEIHHVAESGCSLVHCPSSNLKLGSGIAKIHHYLKKKIKVALGADGAPCNNSMDPFLEMRLAALLQKPIFGSEALSAQTAFELATLGGAAAVGRTHDLGSLESGKLADVVVVRRDDPSVHTITNPYSALVYSCLGRDVRHVFIHGEWIVKDRQHQRLDADKILHQARLDHEDLLQRL
jgi:5-methylthioadenosine/S-adenosylhomocysteine deaminase